MPRRRKRASTRSSTRRSTRSRSRSRSRSRPRWRSAKRAASRARRTSCIAAASTRKGSLMTPGVLSVASEERARLSRRRRPTRKSSWRRRGFAEWLVVARQSADRARDGQPDLAASLRRRHRPHAEQLRQDGRAPVASGAARLAGRRVRRPRLEHQGDAPADDDVGGLSDGERRHRRPTSRSIRRTASSGACRGSGSRRRSSATRSWPSPARSTARSAARTSSRTSIPTCSKSSSQRELARQAGRRSVDLAAQPLRLLEAQHPLSAVRGVRSAEPDQLRAIAATARRSRRRRCS